MRRKTAKELLADSLRELAAERPIDKITVKEIAENCGYSQATFYRQFRDKYDLIAWEYARRTTEIVDKTIEDGSPWQQTLIDGALHFQKESGYLRNLLNHTSGHDSFLRYMVEINYNVLKQYILRHTGEEALDQMTDMYVRIYVLGTVTLTCEWIMGKYDVTPQIISEVYAQSLPQPLRPILME